MSHLVPDQAVLQATLEKRRSSDDMAAAVFQEGEIIVVLRLRREHARRVLIIDDGKGAVRVEHLHTLKELAHILPQTGDSNCVGYEYARRVICRAFNDQ